MLLAVCVLVRRADGRFLFVERAATRPAPGYWTPITGKVEKDERLEDAAVREVKEETGLPVRLSSGELGRSPTRGAAFSLVWFRAVPLDESQTDALVIDPGEVAQARWLAVEDFLRLEPVFTETRSFLVELLRTSGDAS